MKTFLVFCILVAADVYAEDLDFAFVIDGSSSICGGPDTCSNWESILQLIRRIVDSFVIGPDNTQVAVATYGDVAEVIWHLHNYTDKEELLPAIDTVPFPGGELNVRGTVRAAVSAIYSEAGGDRADKRNAGVLFTDGAPFVTNPSTALGQEGFTLFVVCITPECTEDFAKALASPPKESGKTYFLWNDYPSNDAIGDALLEQINVI